MPESLADRGSRRGRRLLLELGGEIRAARLAAGLSQTRVAGAAGVSAGELSRIERGLAPWLDVVTAARLGAVVGLDVVVRAFPGGDALRDAGQTRMLEAFRRLIGSGLVLRSEVPIGDLRDQRAWDATISRGSDRMEVAAIEFESRLIDAQALVRRLNLKRRDGRIDRVIVVFLDRRANRRAIQAAESMLRAEFPLDGSAIRAALRSGRVPHASGILRLAVPIRGRADLRTT
jgi:transcriptional regulator with XRE-family HTH domain